RAALGDLDRKIEEERLVRPGAADGEVGDRAELREVGTVAVALVRERGIEEAIDDDDLARRERGADDVAHELRPGGAVEKRLGVRRERDLLRVKDDVAHALADRGAARLAHRNDLAALRADPLREPLRLDRLAGRLPTLEGKEEAAHLWIWTRRFGSCPVLLELRFARS